jgi:hypothetical protein
MTSQGLPAAQAPLYGVSADDAATIIRELGAKLIDAYNAAHAEEAGDDGRQNLWGSKQREQLLRALITRLARHARMYENAALSTSERALAVFARDAFKHGDTRSKRDRKPITKNVDKVIGGWLRPLKRRLRFDRLERVFHRGPVVTSMAGDVVLAERTAPFRLTLTFAYPWRAATDRRLRITVKLEERESVGTWRLLPFPSNATTERVALPEDQPLRPADERTLDGQLEHVIDLARRFGQHDLATSLVEVRKNYFSSHPIKATAALLLVIVTLGVAASPTARRFVARMVDAIRSSSSLPEMLEKLRADPDQGVFITPGGTQSQVAVSRSGSQLRVSPGPSPDRLHIQAILSAEDASDLADLIVPLAEGNRVGIAAMQYREAKQAPILPWFVEILVVPEQDNELAAELARETASVTITSDPPLPKSAGRRTQHYTPPGNRVSVVAEFHELPRRAQSYSLTATVRRESRQIVERYRAELRVDESGYMTLVTDRGKPLTAVTEDVKVGHPICTSIANAQTLPMFVDYPLDYVQVSADAFNEQEVRIVIFPPAASPQTGAATVDWGDGSRAAFYINKQYFLAKHTYRVGERVYPIKIYFKDSSVVYRFDLYVFSKRGPERDVAVLDYETPYPPNPELTELYAAGWDEDELAVVIRPGSITTDSVSFSRHWEPWVWRTSLGYPTSERRKIRYFWRDGTVASLPETAMEFRER